MEINLELQLPRDEQSIPVVRHICRHALTEVGVDPDCRGDIEVALSEACTNVLKHAGPGEEYGVNFSLDDRHCVIAVTDTGQGFDARIVPSDPAAERGRGIELMRALVDRVNFESTPEAGTVVHLEKDLAFVEQSLTKRAGAGSGAEGDP